MQEIPFISTTMWALNSIREEKIIKKLTDLMATRNDIFAPTIIYGGYLTKKKNQKYDPNSIVDNNLFEKSMSDNNVLSITLTNSDRKKRDILFGLTIDFFPWSTIVKFQVSHSYFTTQEAKEKYLDISKNLITIINPIYSVIDDIGKSLEIMESAKEDTYLCVKDYIPAVFWGNYFGEKYINEYGEQKLLNSPYGIVNKIGNGVLITMTDDLMNYNTEKCDVERKKLSKYLGVGKPNTFKKLFGL